MVRASLCLLFALAACSLDFDGVGPQAAGGAGGSGQGSNHQGGAGATGGGGAAGGAEPAGGAAPTCTADSGACQPLPAGFSGLVQLTQGAGCTGAVVATGSLPGGSITAPDAQCQCQCQFPSALCASALLFSNGACNGGPADTTFSPGACAQVPGIFSYQVKLGLQNGVACSSDGAPPLPPAPFSFDEPHAACAVEAELDCGPGGVCVPQDGQRYCLVADTATSCTSPAFAVERRLLSPSDYDDTRTCSCLCNGPVGAVSCLEPDVEMFQQQGCVDELTVSQGVGNCRVAAGNPAVSMRLYPNIDGACAPGDTPSGTVEPIAGAGLLLCCAE